MRWWPGGVSLAVAVLAVVFGGTAFASACALIGIGFMVGALALAVYEQRDKGGLTGWSSGMP
ncbi:hypothetical protein [Nonomuraea salmonea]|uniref:hypothetical protein n=1 Tax=Nonomuraea salmonea TaxID=46181 RepID=UPI002FE70BDF